MIPPHVLAAIVARGTPTQRQRALRGLAFRRAIQVRRGIRPMRLPLATPLGPVPCTIYDAGGGSALPGRQVRGDSDPPPNDQTVNEAYAGAAAMLDLLVSYVRHSIDGAGLPLVSTVHYDDDPDPGFNNAFWDGTQMVYGDGDGEIFNPFTRSVDVVAHELGHGVTQYSANLEYRDQPGALNEHMSDVFGALVRQSARGETALTADWLIGAELFTSRIHARGLRAFDAQPAYDDPLLGRDPQPKHMRDYIVTREDEGGVHINSGIPNHAFYQAARALATTQPQQATSLLGQVWYAALTKHWGTRTQFTEAAIMTVRAAETLYGATDAARPVIDAVRYGWAKVGLDTGGSSPAPSTPPPAAECCQADELQAALGPLARLFRGALADALRAERRARRAASSP